MIDLDKIVDRFIDEAVSRQRSECEQHDADVIAAIEGRERKCDDRTASVLRWLRRYHTLQGLDANDRSSVATEILRFADARAARAVPETGDEIFREFNSLHDRCRNSVARTPVTDKPRDLTSLSTKALWCCYPDTVPIFDSQAQRALQIITRLLDVRLKNTGNRYEDFLYSWLNIYNRVSIDSNKLNGYPYEVRVFDKILWIVGQRGFGYLPPPTN